MQSFSNLGTRLRHLIDLLDGGVNSHYERSDLGYRARYTPVVRALVALGPSSIKIIAKEAGMTHSAVSQTVAQMCRHGFVQFVPGDDLRERIVAATEKMDRLLPALEAQWLATGSAAQDLNEELGGMFIAAIEQAISALEREGFASRIDRQIPAREKKTA